MLHHQVSHTIAETIFLIQVCVCVSLSLSLPVGDLAFAFFFSFFFAFFFFFFSLQTFSSFLFLPPTAVVVCLKVKILYYVQTRQERVTQFVIVIVNVVSPSICEAYVPWASHTWLCSALSMPLTETGWPIIHCF